MDNSLLKKTTTLLCIQIPAQLHCIPRLAFNPVGQVVSHLYGEMLAIQHLHLMQRIILELLGLNPHCHGATCGTETAVGAEAWNTRFKNSQ